MILVSGVFAVLLCTGFYREREWPDCAVGAISGSERRSVRALCLLISCFTKMRIFFSLTDTHAHEHARAHTRTHAHSLSLSLSLTHTHILSLSHTYSHTLTHTHTHTLQTPQCVAVILFARQPDNIQSAKQFVCEIFLCHLYRRKSKIIKKILFDLAR